MKSKLLGRRVLITDKYSFYWCEWGVIEHFDGTYYHVKIANGDDSMPIFTRNQFRVLRGHQL